MNAKVAIALIAGFGGISPNLLRIAIALTDEKKEVYVGLGYIIGLLLFAVMGAGVALIWGETDSKRAYYLGLGLPSLLQLATASATHGQVPSIVPPVQGVQQVGAPPERSSGFFLFATPAFADSPQLGERTGIPAPADVPVPFREARHLTLVLEDVPEGAELWFTSPDGQVISRVILEESSRSDEGSRVDLRIPDFASSAFLNIETSRSRLLPLKRQERSTTAFRVDVDESRLGGFLKALGVQDASLLKFEIENLR